VVRDVALTLKLSPKRYLMPLSYIVVLTGCCTLIGTSTNLLVDDMASIAGQPRFGIFEISPVGVPMALVGGLYLFLFSGRLIKRSIAEDAEPADGFQESHMNFGAQVGDAALFSEPRPFQPLKAGIALAVFVAAVAAAALGVAPIAATALAGAVLLILFRV